MPSARVLVEVGMQVGDLVEHEYYGLGLVIRQQGVTNRWLCHWFEMNGNGICAVWEHDLVVIQ